MLNSLIYNILQLPSVEKLLLNYKQDMVKLQLCYLKLEIMIQYPHLIRAVPFKLSVESSIDRSIQLERSWAPPIILNGIARN